MNLENLNLVELNAQEVQETEAGCMNCTPFPGIWSGIKSVVKIGMAWAVLASEQNIYNQSH